MVQETIFQNWLFKDFILPFALIFFIVFAILEKTKILGDERKQLNAMLAFVIALIFLGFAAPKDFVANMILFLSVAIVVVLVFLMLYGFATGGESDFGISNGFKWFVGVLAFISVVIAVVWASGIDLGIFGSLFDQTWSRMFWTNFFFVVVIAAAIAVAIGFKGKSGSG